MLDIHSHQTNLSQLSQEIEAPFFYYDLDALQAHSKALQSLPVKLWYALKANPLSSIIKVLADEGVCFDVASIGELDQTIKQGVDPQKILHTGPAKSYEQLDYFVLQGVRIFVLESLQQYGDLKEIASRRRVKIQVLLRVQLQWNLMEKNILGGECITPFGLPAEDWQSYFTRHKVVDQFIEIIGFHCFQWGNIICLKKLTSIWFKIAETLRSLAVSIGVKAQVVDLGGGLGVPYNDGQLPLNLADIKTALSDLKQRYPETEFWLELGRYAVAEYGVYVTKVIDRKKIYTKNMLILEGGSQHLMRPVLTGEAFPTTLLRASKSTLINIHLHGPLCTSLDYLGEVSLPADIQSGDYVIFSKTGAYGFSESMPFFLCHTLPAEVVYRQGKMSVIREAQTAEVWLR